MLFDGSRADMQDLRHLVVRMTRRYELSDLAFSWREDGDGGVGTGYFHAPQVAKSTDRAVGFERTLWFTAEFITERGQPWPTDRFERCRRSESTRPRVPGAKAALRCEGVEQA